MAMWQIVLVVFLFALWVWALVAMFVDVFRRPDLSGWTRIGWAALVLVLPVLGVIVYLLARPRLTEDEQRAVASYSEAVSSDGEARAQQIADLARLHAEGRITDEEYEARKQGLA